MLQRGTICYAIIYNHFQGSESALQGNGEQHDRSVCRGMHSQSPQNLMEELAEGW